MCSSDLSMRAAAVLLGVQTAAPQFAIGRHKTQMSQEIPNNVEKDERAAIARPDAERLVQVGKKRAAHLVP